MNPSDFGTAFIQRLDISPTKGPLDGLTFAVKDNIDVAGTVTGCGSPAWAADHFPAAMHAIVVEMLLNSGARCLGKTIMDEFAFSLVGENHFYGTPRNPQAPEHIPGGSSSGSASVVAAGEVDFALGTDTGGSVRVPAANCGLYGLRPTWGRYAMAGVQALAPSFDTVGIVARDPEMLAQVDRCLFPLKATVTAINTVFILEEAWAMADAEIQASLPSITQRMKAAGLDVKTIRLAALHDGELGADILTWKNAYSAVQWPEIMSIFGGWLDHVKPEIGPKIAENFALAKSYDRSQVSAAVERRENARLQLRSFLQPGTALCLPTTPSPSPLIGKVDYDRVSAGYVVKALALTAFAGIGGLPQVTLPLSTTGGLPIGFSLIGAADADRALISTAGKLVA
jgi:amidase